MKPNIENIKGAVQALRENPQKSKYEMRDTEGGRCCLCVMMDYAKEQGADVRKHKDQELPESEGMEQFYGIKSWGEFSESGVFNFILEVDYASEHNHEEIAEMLEKKFVL